MFDGLEGERSLEELHARSALWEVHCRVDVHVRLFDEPKVTEDFAEVRTGQIARKIAHDDYGGQRRWLLPGSFLLPPGARARAASIGLVAVTA